MNTHLTDTDLDALLFILGRLRGPGVTDPDLPVDPDNERYSQGIRTWAGDRMAELAAERDRRNTRPAGGIAQIVTDDD